VESDEIWTKLKALVAEVLGTDEVALSRETVAADVDGWDSVTHVEILVAIEQTFGVQFRTSELAGMQNVGDLVERLERALH